MFYHLNGVVTELEPNLAVIDCGGVGFAVTVTAVTQGRLKRGERAKLFICEQVREDAFELYGFATAEEKRCFEMLISVSGVGPKAAVSILSANTTERVCMAIMSDDERVLTAAAGVGKRLAQRIILELKDKLSKGQIITHTGEAYAGGVTVIPQDKRSEATAALAVLGYAPGEIATALSGIDMASLELQDIIEQALKKMVK